MKMKRVVLPVIAVIAAATLAALAGWLTLPDVANAQASPPAPASVSATVVEGADLGSAVVSWDGSDGATGYRVQWVNLGVGRVVLSQEGRDWQEAAESVDVGHSGTGRHSLTVNGLADGTTYVVRVGSLGGSSPQWSKFSYINMPEGDGLNDVYDVAILQAAALVISGHASGLVAASGPTHGGMAGTLRESAGMVAGLKANLNAQLPLLQGRGDAERVARIGALAQRLIANAEGIQAGRPGLLRALATEQAGARASSAAELVAAISVSSDDQFDVLMMDEESVSEADRLRYSHLQSLSSNVRLARTLLLVAARLQDPAVVARNQEAYESVAELIQRDIDYLGDSGAPMTRDERIAIAGAQELVDAGSGYFTRLENRLNLTAAERVLIADNTTALAQLQGELGALVAEAQGMMHLEAPMPTVPTGTPGVTSDMVSFGQSAALEGPSSALGMSMQLGIEAAFKEVNDNGGVHGRQLDLTTRDDGYESDLAFATTRQLIDEDGVFGLIGAVGTPTSRAALPLAEAGDVPFVGAFTGAQLLRGADQTNVLNVRASYHDETEQMVELLEEAGVSKVAVLYQNDSYGQDGLAGVKKALDSRPDMELAESWYYARNTIAVKAAAYRIAKEEPEAVIIIGGYAPTAEFIKQLRIRLMHDPVFMAVSFVGSNALQEQLSELGQDTDGVYVTQVVPLPSDENNQLVADYRAALSAVEPDAEPGFISLEGYLAGRLAIERLEACGTDVSRECFLNVFSESTTIDIADGLQLQYGPGDNQGSNDVFLTRINSAGEYELADSIQR